jgi:acetoin utilization protein AcuB
MPRHPKRSITREIRTRRRLHPGREADEVEALTWPESTMRVKNWMTRGAATIHSDALVRGAADMMKTRRLRHLPVVDHGGRLVGIVTDRDLRQVTFAPALQRRLPNLSDALKTLTVQAVMTRGVVTVRPSAEIREAARLMYERKIGALPVVDGDRVAGILTESDVLRALQSVLTEGVLAKPHRWALAYR